MRGTQSVLVIMMMILMALALAGCKENVPQTELDKFIADVEGLDSAAQSDTLSAIIKGHGKRAAYANYFIGNSFYRAAGDTARLSGWTNPGASALLDSAEVYFSAAVAQDSLFVEALVNLGSLWDDRSEQLSSREDRDHKVAQAESFYRLALKVSPADEKARCNLGSLFLRQRRTMEAKEEFQRVLTDNPRSSLAHYNMAIMFAEAKIYREAINEWELAVKYDPDGDIGERSRDNINIVKDLIKTPVPITDPKAKH